MATAKALLIGLEYPSEPLHKMGSSVNNILEFNRLLIDHLHFPPTNIEILTDTSATDWGDKQFDFTQVSWKLSQLILNAKEGDLLVFAFSGHGTFGGPSGPALYLGIDPVERRPIFMPVPVFKNILDQLNRKSKPNKLYMFISACGSGGLLEPFGFINQLRNQDVNPSIVQYPSVVAFMSSRTGVNSKSDYSCKWGCSCSNFIYAAIQAIQRDKYATNLELAQCIDLIIEERDILQAKNRITKSRQLKGDEKKRAREKIKRLNKYVQHATLACSDAQRRAHFLSN